MKKTTNYSQFSYLLGNRDIIEGHVKKLTASISQNNLLPFNPILVTKAGLVIDGQHRLEAAKELGLPIYYNEVDGGLDEVVLLNSSSKNWSVGDFVESYIELGNPEYAQLKEFKEGWGIGWSIAAQLLMFGYKSTRDNNIPTAIREGSFRVLTQDEADEVMSWVIIFDEYTDATIRANRSFIAAIAEIISQDVITISGMKHKLEVAGKMLVRQNTKADYLRQIEEILNYKSRNKIRLY